MTNGITIHKGAFQNHIKSLPKGSADLLVTDPPYLMDTNGGGGFGRDKVSGTKDLDKIADGITDDDLDLIVSRMKMVNAYIWCNKNQLRQYLDYFEDMGCNTDLLTWHKSNPVPRCNNKYLSDTEYCVFAREKGVPLGGNFHTLGKYWITPLNQKDKSKYNHPTIKPLDITRQLICNSSHPGALVIDPFLGSGTTAAACVLEKRKFWGCELESYYYSVALDRVREAEAQLKNPKFDESESQRKEAHRTQVADVKKYARSKGYSGVAVANRKKPAHKFSITIKHKGQPAKPVGKGKK